VVFGIVVFILASTILHAIFRPLHSPFTSTLTDIVHKGYIWSMQHVLISRIMPIYVRPSTSDNGYVSKVYHWMRAHIDNLQVYTNVSVIQHHHVTAYHSIMSQTYDDILLDDGTSTLREILESIPKFQAKDLGRKDAAESMIRLLDYFFSPTASRRSVFTAAGAIIDYKPSTPGKK
jgi:hypothetical protein